MLTLGKLAYPVYDIVFFHQEPMALREYLNDKLRI